MGNLELFNKVKKLNLPMGYFALFGSAPMCIRGLRKCHDIDIVVNKDLFNKLKNSPDWKFKISNSGSKMLLNGEIEVFYDWAPGEWNVKELIENAEIIDDLPFVKLEYLVKWKKIYGREKDFKDIKLIESYLTK